MIFDSAITHLASTTIEITNLKLIVNKLAKKEIVLKLKFRSNFHVDESDTTNPIEQSLNINQKQSIYSWIHNEKEELLIKLRDFSLQELSSASLTINGFDTKLDLYVPGENYDSTDKLSLMTKIVDNVKYSYKTSELLGFCNFNLHKLLAENNNTMTKQSSIIFKQSSAFHKNKGASDNAIALNSSIPNDKLIVSNPPKDKYFETPQPHHSSSEMNIIKFQVFDNIESSFCEELYSEGKIIGTIEGRIKITKIPLIKQIVCGVHTERGFDIASHYLTYNEATGDNNKEILREIKLFDNEANKLMSKLTETTALKTVTKGTDVNKEILEHLQEINKVLLISSKDSCLYYNYSNKEEKLFSQEAMLKLGIGLINIIDNMRVDHGKESYKILGTLLNRAEFDLGSMANYIDDNNEQTLTRRVTIIQDYILFYNLLLSYCLEKFAKKVSDKDVQTFIEHVLSVCYFRIPKFRYAFLEAISIGCDFNLKSKGENIYKRRFNYIYMTKYCLEEHKNLNYFDNIEQKDNNYINPIVSAVDWEDLFYNKIDTLIVKLSKNQKQSELFKSQSSKDLTTYSSLINKIDPILKNSEWKERLSRKNLGFFTVIRKLEEYIRSKIIVNRDIDWEDIPGFDIIIFSLLHEVKIREVSKYPTLLVDALLCFINNATIINIFVMTITRKTNIHDTNAVYKLFDIIDALFHTGDNKISNLKNNFDYNLLKQCFAIILDFDHSLCVAKVFWFLYENCHLLDEEYIGDYIKSILTINFYKLFFHWSYQVRHIFYNFILYTLGNRIVKGQRGLNRRQPQQQNSVVSNIPLASNLPESQTILNIQEIVRERLVEVQSIVAIIDTYQMNSNFKNKISTNDLKFKIDKCIQIPEVCYEYIIISVYHYKEVSKYYESWKDNIKKKKLLVYDYPDMTLTQLKDDIIDYSDNWS